MEREKARIIRITLVRQRNRQCQQVVSLEARIDIEQLVQALQHQPCPGEQYDSQRNFRNYQAGSDAGVSRTNLRPSTLLQAPLRICLKSLQCRNEAKDDSSEYREPEAKKQNTAIQR